MRRAAKVDDNHAEIRDAARKLGAYWHDTFQLKGFCDGMMVFRGETIAVEVKDGSKPPSKRRLTQDEETFRDDWTKAGGTYEIVECVGDLLLLLR